LVSFRLFRDEVQIFTRRTAGMSLETFSAIFDKLDRELWLITAQAGGRRSGLMATYVSRASLVPALPRVTLGLAKHHFTHELIQAGRTFGMHLIDEQRLDWVWRFGIRSGRELDKFSGLETRASASGSPILAEALAWLDCRVEAQLDTGDRTIFLGEVLDAGVNRTGPPLTMKRLIELAPPDKLRELKNATEHDIEIDHQAILAWRGR
jgi:flavin reductase (DIM6/NTAB) family NADH-FMN oxidoreductase RutF